MKIIILIILAALIIVKSPQQELPLCNIATAKQAFAPRIFAETTIDGKEQPVYVTRFLHNKIGIYASEISRCYFNSLDLNFINNSTGAVGLLSLLFFVYKITVKKYYSILAIFLVLPTLPFFGMPFFILIFFYKIFAIIGLVFLLQKK